jgi:hypothetical protein
MNGSITSSVARLHRMQSSVAETPRRTTHGSCAWTLPFGTTTLRQPQDGVPRDGALTGSAQPLTSTRLKQLRSRPATDTDDDRLSGATRSLSNRVLGLNGFTGRRPPLDVEPERYFAEPLRMPPPAAEPLRKKSGKKSEVVPQTPVHAHVA